MTHLKQLDHIGITVADVDVMADFFVGLGLEVEGRTFVEGEFLDTVCFEVEDVPTIVADLAADGYGLVGGVGELEDSWRMAYVRGPEGIVVALAENLG